MAFYPKGSLNPHGGPLLINRVIANSEVITTGDSVKTDADGFVVRGTAGALVLGHVAGIVRKNDLGLLTDGSAGAAIGSFVNTYTVASDNETVDEVSVKVNISKDSLYSAELDASAGTTTGSDLSGYNMDLADEDTLDESTAARTTAQYNSLGLDEVNPARVVVHILESEVFGV